MKSEEKLTPRMIDTLKEFKKEYSTRRLGKGFLPSYQQCPDTTHEVLDKFYGNKTQQNYRSSEEIQNPSIDHTTSQPNKTAKKQPSKSINQIPWVIATFGKNIIDAGQRAKEAIANKKAGSNKGERQTLSLSKQRTTYT